jgi:hypothetical protein
MPGYSGTPLAKKLGFKPGTKVVVVGDVPAEYKSWLAPLPERVTLTSKGKPPLEAVHVFVTKRAELEKHLKHLRTALVLPATSGSPGPSGRRRFRRTSPRTQSAKSACR